MRILLSTIGSRGDVEPLVAVALRIREAGGEARLCVPPDFREWIEELGLPVTPFGPSVRPGAGPRRPAGTTPLARRRLIEGTVALQFEQYPAVAAGCDLIVGGGPMLFAAPSVAEMLRVPYLNVHFCPVSLPSPHHAPPPVAWGGDTTADAGRQWADDARRWNEHWGPAVNEQRKAAGLAAVDDVRAHLFTARPWLAADPVLGPWPGSGEVTVTQTGAWIRPAGDTLPPEVEAFLDAGEPPIYFGLGSTPVGNRGVGDAMLAAARASGRRAIVARGWAELSAGGGAPDCLVVGELDHQALFPRVAAAVHHGGAGTTTAVARAGVPQVILPHRYDQFYWAGRVAELGIGAAHPAGPLTAESLAGVVETALRAGPAARDLAPRVRADGASVAAAGLLALG
ncbi:glycosyl transferase [Actinoplanes italicus]|uniref:Vancomycin aglycone glucosyltransferase n=1 Tax=Actinoplanes italicus TaxID=113567 RepID=A0A2T0JM05_9ACTN|nr:glycosyltransferase [Actinoplanes italicus]PRX08632.1 vancomycin aglycone glucosyltransferase [Actinoplanes italicus]GIE36585.1 glycosyl transferase [Actinoplanes italicus]